MLKKLITQVLSSIIANTLAVKKLFKKTTKFLALLAASIFGMTPSANAADGDAATVEIANGQTKVANATGLLESNATTDVGVILNSGTTVIVFGATAGADSVTYTEAGTDDLLTFTISGTGTIHFRGDVQYADTGADDISVLLPTAATFKMSANLIEIGTQVTLIHMNAQNGTDLTSTVIFDNFENEDQDLAGIDVVKSLESEDTAVLKFRSTGALSADNTTTLGGAVGGAGAAAIDTITFGDVDGKATLVEFTGTAFQGAAMTLGNGGLTADIVKVTFDIGTTADLAVVGTIDGSATDTTILAVDGADGQKTTFDSDIGATTALSSITIGSEDNVDTTTIFEGTVKASTLTIGNTIAGNADIYVVNFENSAVEIVSAIITEALAADVTTLNYAETAGDDAAALIISQTGAVTVDTINVGSATAGGKATFTADVTANTMFTVLGGDDAAEDSVATFNAINMSGEVNLNDATGDSTVVYSGATAQTQTGIVHSATADEGAISLTNTVGTTFTAAVGTGGSIGSVTTSATNIAEFGGILDTALFTHAGSATIKVKNNILDDFDFADGSEIKLSKTNIVSGDTIFILSDDGDATSIVTGAKIYMPEDFQKNENLLLFTDMTNANVTTMASDANDALHDTSVINFVASVESTDDLRVSAVPKTSAVIASELGITINQAAGLSAAYTAAITTGDTTAAGVFETSNRAAATARKDDDLARRLAPQTDATSGSASATRAMTGSIQGIVSNRMAALRSGDAYVSGVSAGNMMNANSTFVQAFGSNVVQENYKQSGATEYGYDADTAGIAIGFDGITESGSVVGLSLSYSETEVKGNGLGSATNDIESYTASLYADKVTDFGYVEGSLTMGINDNAGQRRVLTTDLDRTYKSAYDSEQISLKIGGGVPIEVGSNIGTFVTPFGSVTGTQIATDVYTETSSVANDNLKLTINQDDVNSLIGSIGVKAHAITDRGTPMISISINNEFGDGVIESSNTYTGGGTAFKTSTDVEALSATLGLGYTFGNETVSLNLGFEAEANQEDYLSKYGTVKLIAKF